MPMNSNLNFDEKGMFMSKCYNSLFPTQYNMYFRVT